MEQVISVVKTVLPVFVALGLGMLCRSRKLLSREGIDGLKKVVLDITLPAVLLNAFATTEYTLATISIPFVVFLLCCFALGLGMVGIRLSGKKSRVSPFIASGFEAGMLGYALFAVAFPQESSSRFAILDLGQTIFVFTLYKLLLSGKGSGKAVIRDMVKSPILWAVFAGVLLGATGLYGLMEQTGISAVFHGVADFVAAPTGMVILLTVGYDLVPREIPWKKVGGLIALRLAVMAICLTVLLVLNRWVLGNVVFTGAALLMFLLPPPYVIPVFADEPAERVEISAALSALTLVSLILFTVLCVFIGI